MSLKKLLPLLFISISIIAYSQESNQKISGQILDESSQTPIPFANITIQNSNPLIGTITDINGNFSFEKVALGRYNILVSFIGYEPVIVTDVLVTAAKEVKLTITLKENATSLDEIVLKPRVQKEKPLNRTAAVSAKMLSVEEASRYAGGFDDPARLASSFAGVASNVGSNAIVIRGNAPKFTQWKLEGIEIPNPNHFADLGTIGGGGLTALSSNLLANSDFFTGAFPAEYNNAISGVFDMKMRSGNTSNYEHSAEIGLVGIDFTSEGPLNKKENSSYLVNYRYSTLGLISSLLPEEAQGTNYQDLSFKLKFYSKKAGRFSFWGLGLIDNSGSIAKKDTNLWQFNKDRENEDAKQYAGATGVNHQYFFKNNAYLKSTLALSTSGLDFKTDRLNDALELHPKNEIKNTNYNITFKTLYNKKVSSKHTNRTGFSAVGMNYNLLLKEATQTNKLETLVAKKGFSSLISTFTNSTLALKKATLNVGINTQLFTLNNSSTIEPRFGFSYQMNEKSKLSLGYGLHSRIEQLHTYFIKSQDTDSSPNKDLGFSKAHHFVVGYDWNINENVNLKIEPYLQYLYNIPIVENTTTSLINLEKDWFINNTYVNKGKGENYGIDFTLEKYINNGFYYLISASIFSSKYKTDTNKWYNTRFNRSYLVNTLIGKEFIVGKANQNLLSLNLRFSIQGGDRYSLIDTEASAIEQDVVYNEIIPFTAQTKDNFVSHFTVNYQWNKNKTTQKLSFKVINANNFKEFLGHRYNFKNQNVEEYREALLIPNLSYKISF